VKRLPYNNNSLFQQLIFLDLKITLYNEGKLKIRHLTFIVYRKYRYNKISLRMENFALFLE